MWKTISILKYHSGMNKNGLQIKKFAVTYLIVAILLYGLYFSSTSYNNAMQGDVEYIIKLTQKERYLINTSTCKIPKFDPFNKEVIPFFEKYDYMPCRKLDLLTFVDKNEGFPVLRINNSLLSSYSFFEISCCYSNITRINFEYEVDDEVEYSECLPFQKSTRLYYPFIRVECSTIFGNVYVNTHASILPVEDTSRSLQKDSPSILFVAIDSMSKLNLARTMPKVYEHLEKNYLTLEGYNKIGDNTFPNLMAILTGENLDTLEKICNKTTKLNYCNLIWDDFKKSGYTTAYAEDDGRITTFNYFRLGFSDPPTHYYYHPYMMASEETIKQKNNQMRYCSGLETSGERILNAATDFSITHKNVPTFGIFWMNSFSHENVNLPSAMENVVYNFLTNTEFLSSLNNTVFIFFSDHGYRFGDIRNTESGWFEERLPYIYIHVPENFRNKFPDLYNNMLRNQNRLTSPFDVYKTLQEILKMDNGSYVVKNKSGCPKCISLFQPIHENRTCEEAGIVSNWCTCYGNKYTSNNMTLLKPIADFIIRTINDILVFNQDICAKYKLAEIRSTRISDIYLNSNNETFQVVVMVVSTIPDDKFEGTIEVMNWETYDYRLSGTINRLTWYKKRSKCINDADLKKYCQCKTYQPCKWLWFKLGFCQ